MSYRRVRQGSSYVYDPVPLDRIDGKTGLTRGDVVVVKNQHGCPPANTMGHCYVEKDGKFAGMVCTNSLVPLKEWKKREKE